MKKVLLVADIGGHETQQYYHIGDEAMFYETYRWYRRSPRKWKISALSWFITHQKLQLTELPHMHWSQPGLIYFPLLLMKLVWWRVTRHSLFSTSEFALVTAIAEHDRIHFSGGGNLSSTFRPWLYYCFFIIFTAKLTGKEIVLTSQTIGPIKGIDLFFAFVFLNMSALIALRSKTSRTSLIRKYGLFIPKIKTMLDAAYTLPLCKTPIKVHNKKGQVKIGLSLHAWKGFEDETAQPIIQALSDLAKKYSLAFVLIPHHLVENASGTDMKFMKMITSQLPKKIKVITPDLKSILASEHPPESYIKKLTAAMDVMLTTRYHGVIFALSTNVPTLSLNFDQYYQEKNNGALELVYQEQFASYFVNVCERYAQEKIKKRLHWLINNGKSQQRVLKKINQHIDTRINQLNTIMLEFNSSLS